MIRDFVHHITSAMVSNCDTDSAAAVARRHCPDGDAIVTQRGMDAEHARLLVCLQADMDDRIADLVEELKQLTRRMTVLEQATSPSQSRI
ncbi:hypothetical protein [Streptomyces sp. NPDC048057]|uniref:hypothetical protein n=1 Tax=Streptomyces sp. NPDC048057 TaxID=3155628 RepID=UPI0033C294E3